MSPERTKKWTEPKANKQERKVAVVYYLSRNGQLDHPHFIEVSLSSSEGLYLRDVINRLNTLRGKGMAAMYTWSSKRSYKNGFVWHDLSENDFIYPAHGHEYILKGSELLKPCSNNTEPLETSSKEGSQSSSPEKPSNDVLNSSPAYPSFRKPHRRNPSWSSFDLNEYKVYKAEAMAETSFKAAADASTQTDEKRRKGRENLNRGVSTEEDNNNEVPFANFSSELCREEISPPPSSSSPSSDFKENPTETLESLIRSDFRTASREPEVQVDMVSNVKVGKASSVLMQLISCGSISVKDYGVNLLTHGKPKLAPRDSNQVRELEYVAESGRFNGVSLEDKEYFSGSVFESNKERGSDEMLQSLKRSSSYNADRCSKSEIGEREIEGGRAKCIPRKLKSGKREHNDAMHKV
ncbi:hypothetical protein AMTR_s00178p00038720 [Amborella trichopoda]|uniref:SOSEKI DIX-like domain-containing protein n=2 Tax=Amborella trichopoda TaxID=13333 RepID=W1PSP1_AMBTC|nr:hypothetical protein AMTR_s00178p00038720 [Amborella trichopoda]